ncbi:MAG TPA: hypothetical protein VG649_08940 [Candidatus Angelobacter sp.]|nr:hypothetical protein [Candidatus Angelobacter sp.]
MPGEKTYRSGEQVPSTGLYRVSHYQHRMPHDAVLRRGEVFPACNKCGERVTFKLSANAEPISNDQDFLLSVA